MQIPPFPPSLIFKYVPVIHQPFLSLMFRCVDGSGRSIKITYFNFHYFLKNKDEDYGPYELQ